MDLGAENGESLILSLFYSSDVMQYLFLLFPFLKMIFSLLFYLFPSHYYSYPKMHFYEYIVFIQKIRLFGKHVLEQISNTKGLTSGLEFLCSSDYSLSVIFLGKRHALKLVIEILI